MRTDHVTLGPRRWHLQPSPLRRHRPSGAAFALGTFVTLFLLSASALAPRAAKADFIYQIQNYPADQNGYTVTGTISTFEVPFKEIFLPASIDVTSWDITITGPGTSISLTPANSFADGFIDLSPTTLSVASPGFPVPGGGDGLSFTPNGWPELPLIVWVGPPAPDYAAYSTNDPSRHILWNDTDYNPSTQPVAVRSLSAVPEPSAVVLFALGAVSGIAYGLVRKRRSQRRQGDAGHTQGSQPHPCENLRWLI